MWSIALLVKESLGARTPVLGRATVQTGHWTFEIAIEYRAKDARNSLSRKTTESVYRLKQTDANNIREQWEVLTRPELFVPQWEIERYFSAIV